jgi:hypothetical protein
MCLQETKKGKKSRETSPEIHDKEIYPIILKNAQYWKKKGKIRLPCLYSVEIVHWCVPVDFNGFLAFWISANKFLFNDFPVKTASKRFFKGICGVKAVWRFNFKRPIAIRASEEEFRYSHETPSNHCII